MRKDQRSAMKSQLDEVSAACSKAKELASETDADEHDTAISTAGGEGADPADADAAALQRYEDASTVAMFGSAVDVVVDDNLFQDDAEDVDDADEDPSLEASIAQLKNQKREREPSRLQRALRKAKFMMTQKKSKRSSSGSSSSSSNDKTSQSGKRNSSKGATSKLLLSKVLGKPVHGRKSSDAKKASKRH